MLGKLNDIYKKHVLMENRFEELTKRIVALEKEIETLRKNSIKDPFSCRKCETGKYRPTGNQRRSSVLGIVTGTQWKCDNPECGDTPDELMSQRLSKL